MSSAKVSKEIEIEYDTFGDPSHPALLLIRGYGAQMVAWDNEFCKKFVDRGLFVVRFDNRDCGLSTKLEGVEVDVNAVIGAAMLAGPMPQVPYTLSDMAKDAVGLLDHLSIDKAHILGESMGGMIAQVMTIEHPNRVRTLISVMSMTGELEYGQSSPEALTALLSIPPTDRAGYIEHSVVYQAYQSKKHRSDEVSKRNAQRDYDRSFYPQGAPRQLAAIYASGPRTTQLPLINTPTLVIHGNDDTLIGPSGGQRTAELIPGARFALVNDMGHDWPEPLWSELVELITDFTSQH